MRYGTCCSSAANVTHVDCRSLQADDKAETGASGFRYFIKRHSARSLTSECTMMTYPMIYRPVAKGAGGFLPSLRLQRVYYTHLWPILGSSAFTFTVMRLAFLRFRKSLYMVFRPGLWASHLHNLARV